MVFKYKQGKTKRENEKADITRYFGDGDVILKEARNYLNTAEKQVLGENKNFEEIQGSFQGEIKSLEGFKKNLLRAYENKDWKYLNDAFLATKGDDESIANLLVRKYKAFEAMGTKLEATIERYTDISLRLDEQVDSLVELEDDIALDVDSQTKVIQKTNKELIDMKKQYDSIESKISQSGRTLFEGIRDKEKEYLEYQSQLRSYIDKLTLTNNLKENLNDYSSQTRMLKLKAEELQAQMGNVVEQLGPSIEQFSRMIKLTPILMQTQEMYSQFSTVLNSIMRYSSDSMRNGVEVAIDTLKDKIIDEATGEVLKKNTAVMTKRLYDETTTKLNEADKILNEKSLELKISLNPDVLPINGQES